MRSWLAAVAVSTAAAILLAGCAAPAGPRPGPGTVTSSWVNGTKAQALALARQLLAELSFPPGTSRRT